MFFSGAGATRSENDLLDEFLQLDEAAAGGAAWLLDDVGGADGLSDDRLLALLPPLPSDPLHDGLEGAGPGAGARGAPGGRRSGEGGLSALPPFPAVDDGHALHPAATPAAAHAWRCLDGKHAAGCTACTQPPTASQESHVVLSTARGEGTGGSGRGLNELRAALLLTPEWNSTAAREAAAVSLEGALAGGPFADLPAVLRAKGARALKKGHLITLCRHWRYRSDVWCAPLLAPCKVQISGH